MGRPDRGRRPSHTSFPTNYLPFISLLPSLPLLPLITLLLLLRPGACVLDVAWWSSVAQLSTSNLLAGTLPLVRMNHSITILN